MMSPVQLTVNGRTLSDTVEARTHLADFLRERLTLTATHLRCEQGVCGACTLLIDGQPARSCITYVHTCDGAEVTTLEGLENDPVIAALREAFSRHHGLQCGYCTPGMLVTARDIVLRLPEADEDRIRLELSGNLCRCTGYVGIVRAIGHVLEQQRKGDLRHAGRVDARLGPVGARPAHQQPHQIPEAPARAMAATSSLSSSDRPVLGLQGRPPNILVRQSFTISRPSEEVWTALADTTRLVHCIPGASLLPNTPGEHLEGSVRISLGPITANFTGSARIARDDVHRRGTVLASANDSLGGSRASGELEYGLDTAAEGTRVSLTIRALLTGPLAQFSRSGIVEAVTERLTATFAQNLEAQLLGRDTVGEQPALAAGSLVWQVMIGSIKRAAGRFFQRSGS